MLNGEKRNLFFRSFLVIIFLFSSGCIPILTTPESDNSAAPVVQYEQDLTYAETDFYLQVPEPVSEDLVIELIDDVTGIELNPTRYAMEKTGELSYKVSIPLKIGSVIKYRYFRNGNLPIYETDSRNQIIDYRAVFINSAIEFNDLITNWIDKQFNYEFGRIEGQVLNTETNSPLPNLLVIAGGVQTFTNSLGNFSIEQLPPGKHTVVVLSTDGEFQVFQQEAIVDKGMTTMANIAISPTKFVNVTFIVQSPVINQSSMRIVGNIYQLGNIFGNIFNGESVVASRAPVLSQLPDGTNSISLSLPVGFNLVYKYTLGNGFWNSELTSDGKFNVRQIIVPDHDLLVNDFVTTFQAPETSKIEFKVSIPHNTPDSDIVSIQFSPFGWSSPIPMTKLDNGKFYFTLYGPFNMVNDVNYRFCRNDSCGNSVDMPNSPTETSGNKFSISNVDQVIEDEISGWTNWSVDNLQSEIVVPNINQRDKNFLVGFEQSTDYDVYVPVYSEAGYQSMKELNANVVIIPLEWSLQSLNPVIIAPIAGENPLWKDILSEVIKAKKIGLQVVLSPKLILSSLVEDQLHENVFQNDWENEFLLEYSKFMIFASDLAQFTEIRGLVIPTRTVFGINSDNLSTINDLVVGNLFSQVSIINDHYFGDLFVETNPDETNLETETYHLFDHILIKADWDLSQNGNNLESYKNEFQNRISGQLQEIHNVTNLPITIILDYPSTKGAEIGCVVIEDECLGFDFANQLFGKQLNVAEMDLQVQNDVYMAALSAINENDWVSGIISKGYNVQVSSLDSSSSVRGKPAGDLLWYWYPSFMGIQ